MATTTSHGDSRLVAVTRRIEKEFCGGSASTNYTSDVAEEKEKRNSIILSANRIRLSLHIVSLGLASNPFELC